MTGPDEFNVRMAWVTTGIGPEGDLNAEFDRWLEQERAEAKREGWRDCALAIQDGLGAWDALEHYGRSETEEDRHVDAKVERERDAAVARAEAAEKRHTWPKTTPTGHAYIAPDTYAALCHQHGNAAQATIESWDADECPPEPTWEMVGIARREVERRAATIATLQGDFLRVERERDEWKARADKWHGAWQKSAPSPAVSRDDIDRALINVTSNAMNYPNPSQMAGKDTEPLRRKCVDAMCDLFGVEAEPADPVDARARAEADNRYSGTLNHAFVEGAMWATRHVEPKDRHVDQ